MPETIQSRRIQADFDIGSGRSLLSTKGNLRQGDILLDRNGLEEVVAAVAPLFNSFLPAHVLTLQRGTEEKITARTYVCDQEKGRGYLVRSSQQSLLISDLYYDIYDTLLAEAGQ